MPDNTPSYDHNEYFFYTYSGSGYPDNYNPFYDYYYYYNTDYLDNSENATDSPIPTVERSLPSAINMVGLIALCIEIPAICLAAYALYRLVRPGEVAPLYIINLLISDLIQVIIRPALAIKEVDLGVSQIFSNPIAKHLSPVHPKASGGIRTLGKWVSAIAYVDFSLGIFVNIGFMVCVSLERYLMISKPMWYHCRRTVKHSALISLAVWVTAATYLAICLVLDLFWNCKIACVLESIYFLIPFPVLLFVFVGTWRALSHSTLCHAEKKRILGILVLVIFNYTLFFLPTIVYGLWKHFLFVHKTSIRTQPQSLTNLDDIATVLLYISPFVDVLLYIFMGKHVKEILVLFQCCRRQTNHNGNRTTVRTVTELLSV
ncbi:G-protein coupled receptor 4-like [Anguilla anguilla]|uniref:G-protein coupled receptor 4-like n=1 Tax=Anguilla anguilla TaxID=7936 RepID=UPI0015A8A180|nr:G-protein coupled receptor 4-like [Anguilla anguilla]